MAKSSLGRGLSAILEEIEESYIKDISAGSQAVKEIPLEEIRPNPFQPRKIFDETALSELSESIKAHGLLQPILVTKEKEGYLLIAGERRLRATKLLGASTIRAIVGEIDMRKLRELALIENIQRADLNPIEVAHSYQELINEHGITHEELASFVKKSRVHITNTLRLLALSEYGRQMLLEEKITSGHAKVLVGLTPAEEKIIIDSIIGQKLSVRDTEKLMQTRRGKMVPEPKSYLPKPTRAVAELELKALVRELELMGYQAHAHGGELRVLFDSQESVDRLLELVGR